jgi:transcriptional antiterminator NusG
MGIEEPKQKIDFTSIQNVKVSSGPFENFVGKVIEINQDKQKVKGFNFYVWKRNPYRIRF